MKVLSKTNKNFSTTGVVSLALHKNYYRRLLSLIEFKVTCNQDHEYVFSRLPDENVGLFGDEVNRNIRYKFFRRILTIYLKVSPPNNIV